MTGREPNLGDLLGGLPGPGGGGNRQVPASLDELVRQQRL